VSWLRKDSERVAEEGFREGLHAIAERNGLEPEAFIETGIDLVHQGGYVTGRSDEKTFWEAMRQKTGMDGTDELLRNIILSHFELRTWMIELIKKLRQSNMHLGILSDHTNWLDELDATYAFFKWFDYIFNSYHVGKSKRDPSLFDDLLALMNIKPDKVLFVDDYHGNIERAKQKGLHALLYEDRLNFLHDLARFCPFIRQRTAAVV
jgi:putative hydrolase of the HAD superfamily